VPLFSREAEAFLLGFKLPLCHSGNALQLAGQNAAQFGSFIEVNIHDLEADFSLPCPAEQHLSVNVAHAQLQIEGSFRAQPQVIVLGGHSTAHAEFTNCYLGTSPGTAGDG